tara:strand:+ start:578 stop:772 length:195 start_codon:yes stop_codon:yes gene_type:complete
VIEDKFRAFVTDLKPVIEKHYPNTDIEWEDYNEDWDEKPFVSYEKDNVKWRVTKLYLDMEKNYD